jgi:hypothetical protein
MVLIGEIVQAVESLWVKYEPIGTPSKKLLSEGSIILHHPLRYEFEISFQQTEIAK